MSTLAERCRVATTAEDVRRLLQEALDSPEDVLKRRYAAGAISRREFRQMLTEIASIHFRLS